MDKIEFTKMHGCGNDFIIIDEITNGKIPERLRPKMSMKLCRRVFSVGANGILFLSNSSIADARMRLFEQDGSESDMCGNGIRCVAKYLHEILGFGKKIKVETRAGIKIVNILPRNGNDYYIVNMGIPSFSPESVHIRSFNKKIFWNYPFKIENKEFRLFGVNTGEPHLVSFIDNLREINVKDIGSKMRFNEIFISSGVNVNFVEISGENKINIRTYERGVEDETLACGTGATASAIISSLVRELKYPIDVICIGGELRISQKGKNVFLEGPAEFIFNGYIDVENLKT